VSALRWGKRKELEKLLEKLQLYGLFIVPVGEVERWVTDFGVEADPKKTWLTRVFTAMGADPESSSYVTAKSGDVWSFIESIEVWVEKRARLGID